MSDAREAQFKKLVADFPQSPMPHFSLGKLYLEQGRYPEAIGCLEEANRRQSEWAAALVALAEAYAGAGQVGQAKTTYATAKEIALKQKHPSLAEEIDEKVEELG